MIGKAPPSRDSHPKFPTIFLLLILALGIPSFAVVNFTQWAYQHPWQAIGLSVFYEIGILLLGIALDVWRNLKGDWIPAIATLVDTRIREILFGYRRRYLNQQVYRNRHVDTKGLSTQVPYALELNRVFVDLTMLPTAPHEVSPDPVRAIPKLLREGRRAIWDYLDATDYLAVLGPPGSGKTTLLKYMVLTIALKMNKHPNISEVLAKLPVLLFVREHAQSIQECSQYSLAQAIHTKTTQWEMNIPLSWIEHQLRKGRCLIMLDGLDEVGDAQLRREVVRWVEHQITTHGNNRFIITSRPYGYQDNPLSNVAVLEIQPFSQDQVRNFVENWYLVNEVQNQQKDDPGVRMVAREGAADLLTRVRASPALLNLAVNPLLLTMIATIHRYRSSLPRRRVELYAEICEVFLGTRRQARGLDLDLTAGQKMRVLEPLAYRMMVRKIDTLSASDACRVITPVLRRVSPKTPCDRFLQQVENTSGLLLEREEGSYVFAHLTFQEYLAATHIRNRNLEGTLESVVTDSWWRETILLYAAQSDATAVVTACLRDDPPTVSALVLAIECLEEAKELDAVVRDRLDTLVNQGIEEVEREHRKTVAEAMLELRLRRLRPLDENRCVDPTLVSCAEYQLFLDQKRSAGLFLQPDHWLDYSFPQGHGRRPVLGVRASDAVAFCDWLTRRDSAGWYYRLPKDDEFNEFVHGAEKEMAKQCHWSTERSGRYRLSGAESTVEEVLRQVAGLEIDSEFRFDRVLSRALDLSQAQVSIPDLERSLELELSLGLERSISRTRALRREQSLGIDQARSRASAVDLDVDIVLSQSLDLGVALDLDNALGPGLELAPELDRAGALNLARAAAYNRGKAIQDALKQVFLWISTRDHDAVMRPVTEMGSNAGWEEVVDFLCLNGILYAAMLLFIYLDFRKRLSDAYSWTDRMLLPAALKEQEVRLKEQIDAIADLYFALKHLLARRRGLVQALEGIRIVREYRKTN